MSIEIQECTETHVLLNNGSEFYLFVKISLYLVIFRFQFMLVSRQEETILLRKIIFFLKISFVGDGEIYK